MHLAPRAGKSILSSGLFPRYGWFLTVQTSSLATGTILPDMQMTKMPGRLYPSPVWRVKGDFGVGGDSGAWVIDNATGGVCGHVTAYSQFWEYATIAPMEVMLHDMEEILGATVSLPDTNQGATAQSFQHQFVDRASSHPEIRATSQHSGGKMRAMSFCLQEEEADVDFLSNLDRKETIDSNHTAGTEQEEKGFLHTSPPASPVLAASPAPSSHMSAPNLNNVAEKWAQAQAGKRDSMDRCPQDDKGKGATVHVQEGLKAKC